MAAINEPFLLSSYSVIQRSKIKNQRRQTGVYASYQKPSSNSDGFVSVAAQADGVHVVDVATLHPIISHTLGPSTTFACAPLTQHQSSKNTHTTYAVIASSPDVETECQGKTIWKWIENLSGPLTDRSSSSSKNQHETLVPHLVLGLYDCDELPERILAISPSGDISLLTTALHLKTTHPASGDQNEVLSAHVFPRSSCSFLGSRSEGAAVVLVIARGDAIQVEVYSVDGEDLISSVIVNEVPLSSKETATTSCSSSGILNIITHPGLWHTFSLTPSSLSAISMPIQLTQLSFITSATPSSPSKKPQSNSQKQSSKTTLHPTPSLLALTSSHVLFASPTPQNEIALLLWDTQYSVLLASYILHLPSSLIPYASSLTLTLLAPGASGVGITAGSQQAILVISQSISEVDGKTPIKSSVYVVPYNVPARSTLANAIGRANASARWVIDGGSATATGGEEESPQDVARAKLVSGMQTALEQNRPQAANALFMEWEKREQEKVRFRGLNYLGDGIEKLGYAFVKDVLKVVIQPQKPPNPLYSSEVVRHLVEKGVVRSAMLEGGLLASLRIRNDWVCLQSIDLALRYVPDLSENELIETLNIIANNTSPTSADPNAMQVDPTPSNPTPTLQEFLATLLRYRVFTTPQLILAFRLYLRTPEAITAIAQILDEWMRKVQAQEVKLLPSKKDVVKNEHGALVIKEDAAKPKAASDLPSIDKILNFLQSLLDASFLTLLQHPPAHKILKNLKAHIEPEIAAFSQTEQIRGLVEGFARAHVKAVKSAEEGKAKDTKNTGQEGSKKDWRQRRREAHEQVGMAVGAYQLEELVL
ncbi:hypothetical protein P691DRAFT_665850 [Macrolepiota fuliginosa MF-IS2]|uniref:Uncharacterized protein n=1 Tax=Macrolepiota fuliginosa MF-IS2 TaxID=1400762 RepID=A0A9P6C311_9AGAR|nr:hypothetical protein P691DRAFT_665850 [Macrolepiota fuliginosa MF-IS2]